MVRSQAASREGKIRMIYTEVNVSSFTVFHFNFVFSVSSDFIVFLSWEFHLHRLRFVRQQEEKLPEQTWSKKESMTRWMFDLFL